jgi:pimeloyl-ACP methyl ester carboxylesterase
VGTTRFATNEIARLAYEVAGPEDTPPVVLAHATLLDRASFAPVRDALLATGRWRVIQPDARGHGASAMIKGRALTVNDLANDLFAVLAAEGLDDKNAPPVRFIGHGQGAVAALALARWRPDRAAALTLIEPELLTILDDAQDPQIVAARDAAGAANANAADASYKELPDRATSLYLDRRWGAGWRDHLPKPRLAAIRRHAPALVGTLDALAAYRLTPDDLAPLTMPVELVVSDRTPTAERAVAGALGSWLNIEPVVLGVTSDAMNAILEVYAARLPATR